MRLRGMRYVHVLFGAVHQPTMSSLSLICATQKGQRLFSSQRNKESLRPQAIYRQGWTKGGLVQPEEATPYP